MHSSLQLLLSLFPFISIEPAPPSWEFVPGGHTGILALEAVVVSPTLAVLFDRVQNNPLQINCSHGDHKSYGAWGALWNFETNVATPLELKTNTFCAGGGFLSNGTMVNVGGNGIEHPDTTPNGDGRMGIRLFEPCETRDGAGCTVWEDIDYLHLAVPRWYPTSVRIFDGSLLIAGGVRNNTASYNDDPLNNFEFYPKKDGGAVRHSPFLEWSMPANLFPRAFPLPDGTIFMVANNRSMIYNVETQVETRLPDIPNGVRVTNPLDGTAILLPLHPPYYIPEVLVCGGTTNSDTTPFTELSSQDPASDQCSRITLTEEGIKRGWIVEKSLDGRVMPELLLLPDGKAMIINGCHTGYAAFGSVSDPINNSNCDHAALRPIIYDPEANIGHRFTQEGLPSSEIARVYHSSVTLTPNGNIFIAGSNPHRNIENTLPFPTEFRAEYLNPPYYNSPRPVMKRVPKKLAYDMILNIDIGIPRGLKKDYNHIKVALMDLGFSTHAYHQGARLVFLQAKLSSCGTKLTIITPPNNRIYPPGPGYIFVTVNGVPSKGAKVLIGNGLPPPVRDQGRQIYY